MRTQSKYIFSIIHVSVCVHMQIQLFQKKKKTDAQSGLGKYESSLI